MANASMACVHIRSLPVGVANIPKHQVVPSMTVLDNVMTACHIHMEQKLIDAVLRTPKFIQR
jgi:ABC-type branched-subunit amino acid transport system ATPase component